MKVIDLTGQTFGRWTVVSRSPNTAKGQARWACRCVCGGEKVLTGTVLTRGVSRSCGCLKDETQIARSTKHGHATGGVISPTYHSWAGMVARCTNSKHRSFPQYGGAGIVVDARWLTFSNFLADMGEKQPGQSIDRIDNTLGYSPGNCRWADGTTQARNKSNNTILTLNGVSRTIAEWSAVLGLNKGTISWRYNKGLSVEDVLAQIKQSAKLH